jgi:cobalamin biosynthesis protein CbiG
MAEIAIRVETLREGQHPSEVVVAVETAGGRREQMIVDRRAISSTNTISVGYALAHASDRLLVELPRETIRGEWRVWVPLTAVVEAA